MKQSGSCGEKVEHLVDSMGAPMISREHLLPAFQMPYRVRYVLVCPRDQPTEHVPDCFAGPTMLRLAWLPKSIPQYLDPVGEYQNALWHGRFLSHWFGIAYDEDFAEVASEWYWESAMVAVFFVNTNREDCFSALRSLTCPLLVTSDDDAIIERLRSDSVLNQKTFLGLDEFRPLFESAVRDASVMLRQAGHESIAATIERKLGHSTEIQTPDDLRFTSFAPCRPNYMTMLQLLCAGRGEDTPVDDLMTEERVSHIVTSTKQVAGILRHLCDFEREGKSFDGFRPPLVLVAPYHDPRRTKTDVPKVIEGLTPEMRPTVDAFISARRYEQDSKDYRQYVSRHDKGAKSTDGLRAALSLAAERSRFLDDIGYLHCTFQCSPYLRLPVKGRSLNAELSPFSPAQFGQFKTDRKIRGKIDAFGRKAASLLPIGVEDLLGEYADQLVVISDLPVEWFQVRSVPLAFLCDVCRMPESMPANLMAQYTSNTELSFVIGDDILEKTLVVCGSPDDPHLAHGVDILQSMAGDSYPKVTIARCDSLDSFHSAVLTHRPQLLIIDTHGNFTSNEVGSTLRMGKDTVTGADIVRLGLAAPLVILSCCITAPLYGATNTIAHAFFEAGARTVLSTFLPISAQNALILYVRMLGNLNKACCQSLHPNWLSFVSHNLRTSLFEDYLARLEQSGIGKGELNKDDYSANNSQWKIKTMMRIEREESFHECAEIVTKSFPPSRHSDVRRVLEAVDIVPEYLYYTHLGRADLVPFASWLKAHHSPASADGGRAIYENYKSMTFHESVRTSP